MRGRPKQEITKDVELRVRIESEIKNQYVKFCKSKKYVLSKRIRQVVINDMNQ